MDIATAIDRLQRMLQVQDVNLDESEQTSTECIQEAVNKYAHDHDVIIKEDLTGDGTQVLDMPSDFLDDFSNLISVEYPIDEVPRSYIEAGDYSIYKKVDNTLQLVLYEDTPATGDTVRLEFSKYISLMDDVPTKDTFAVLNLSAYYACLRESQKASNTTSDGDALDFVDLVESASRYQTLADKFKMNYDNHIFGDVNGIEARGKTEAGMAIKQWDTTSRWNEPRVFHEDDN